MVIDRTAWQRRQGNAARRNRLIAFMIRVANDGVGVRDIEVVADRGHAEGRMEMVEKDRLHRRLSPCGIIAQERDAVARPRVAPEVTPFSMNRMTMSFGLVMGCGGGAFNSTTRTSPLGSV